jgi:hypothetical protein
MEMKGSGEGHVATICERGDDETARVPEVLIPVREVGVRLAHDTVALRPCILLPVEAKLHEPLKRVLVNVGDLEELVEHVTRVHLDCDEGNKLLSLHLVGCVAHCLGQFVQQRDLRHTVGSN